jgi:phosphoglycerol transferase
MDKTHFLPSVPLTTVIWYSLLLVLTALFLVITLGLASGVRFDVPFIYEGDGLEYNLLTKTLIDSGWWIENPMVGVPGKLEMYDYPVGNNLDFLIMKILSVFSGNYAVVMNGYYILGFFLTAVCSLYVFRELRISYPVGIFGSILYTFLFFHFNRIGHFNLVSYYMIPLIILVILRVCQGDPLFIRRSEEKNSPGSFQLFLSSAGIISIIIILIASTHTYYGFFAILLLAVATLFAYSRSFNPVMLVNGGFATVLLAGGMMLNKLPSILYYLSHGPSFAMKYRYPYESEIWGMKLIQLILPAPGHNIPFLSEIAGKYSENRPLVNENVSATLGIIGTIGFLLLLMWVFLRGWQPLQKRLKDRSILMDSLSLLTISAVLIGTIGGISAIIAQVFPEIHSYNRISLFISFFAILAVAFILQLVYEQYRSRPYFCHIFLVLLLSATVFGIYDQVPSGYSLGPDSDREKEFFAQDEYFSDIETNMTPGSWIFILPDSGGFPNYGPQERMKSLDSVKPYLHTHTLKWSYPTMRDRFWDNWQIDVTSSDPAEILGHLFITDFSGLLVDGYGYSDGGREMITNFTSLTGISPYMSGDGRYAFFDLSGFMEKKKSVMTRDQFTEKQQEYFTMFHSRYPDTLSGNT